MPAAQAALVPELEDALRHIAADKYAETMRRVADFFLAGVDRFGEEHVRLFDRVLGRLIVALDDNALAELARRLAPVRNAPPDVIRRLAGNPEIAVAAPVLTRSRRLDEADLVALASTCSQAHLLAISGRPDLGEAVTEVLAERGDRDVARNLALNPAARFSDATLAMLIDRAAGDAILAEKLGNRSDLPPHLRRRLLVRTTTDVRERLLAAASPEFRSEIEQAIAEGPEEGNAIEDAEIWRTVRALDRAGRLDEAQVLAFAENGRMKQAIAAIALICGVSIDVVRRLLGGDQPDAALILCQAAGFSWPTARAIVQAGTAKSARKAERVFDDFAPLARSTAAHIVDFLGAAGDSESVAPC
jgi:uncharacterized protein (DUF2336 family)